MKPESFDGIAAMCVLAAFFLILFGISGWGWLLLLAFLIWWGS